MTRIFHLFFYVKDGSHVRLWHPSCVYITAQREYTAVQKMCTYFWNNFPCITSLRKISSDFRHFFHPLLLTLNNFWSSDGFTIMHAVLHFISKFRLLQVICYYVMQASLFEKSFSTKTFLCKYVTITHTQRMRLERQNLLFSHIHGFLQL